MAPPGKKKGAAPAKPKPKPVVKATNAAKSTAAKTRATAKDLEAAAKTLMKLSKSLKKPLKT
jgi:hypothetical protein